MSTDAADTFTPPPAGVFANFTLAPNDGYRVMGLLVDPEQMTAMKAQLNVDVQHYSAPAATAAVAKAKDSPKK